MSTFNPENPEGTAVSKQGDRALMLVYGAFATMFLGFLIMYLVAGNYDSTVGAGFFFLFLAQVMVRRFAVDRRNAKLPAVMSLLLVVASLVYLGAAIVVLVAQVADSHGVIISLLTVASMFLMKLASMNFLDAITIAKGEYNGEATEFDFKELLNFIKTGELPAP